MTNLPHRLAVALLAAALAVLLPAPATAAAAGAATGTTTASLRVGAPRSGPVGGTWTWPLSRSQPGVQPVAPPVVRGFQAPAMPWSAGHRGVDLLAEPGAVVVAAGDGVVSYAGRVAGRGVVSVAHGTLRTTYEPVRATLAAGARVKAGEVVGRLESRPSHCPPRSCLHWGLRRGDTYLDPLSLVGRGPTRLLPLWERAGPANAHPLPGTPDPPDRLRDGPAAPMPQRRLPPSADEDAPADMKDVADLATAGTATGLALAGLAGVATATRRRHHAASRDLPATAAHRR
jgi:murein DD-endopeptidase MepM/ murein hydrolase activator NlpD